MGELDRDLIVNPDAETVPDLETILQAGAHGGGNVYVDPTGTILAYGRAHAIIQREMARVKGPWMDLLNDGWQRIAIYRDHSSPNAGLRVAMEVAGVDRQEKEDRLSTAVSAVQRIMGPQLEDATIDWAARDSKKVKDDSGAQTGSGLGSYFIDHGIKLKRTP